MVTKTEIKFSEDDIRSIIREYLLSKEMYNYDNIEIITSSKPVPEGAIAGDKVCIVATGITETEV